MAVQPPSSPTAVSGKGRFEICLAALLRTEGGYVDHPNDRGGATNYGISLRFLQGEVKTGPALATDLGLAPGHVPTAQDIRALTPIGAALIYRRCFWDRMRCDLLPAPVDGAVFDFGVNAGPGTAVKLLQRAINSISPGAVAVDSAMGVATVRAAQRAGAGLLAAYRAQVEAHYRAIVRMGVSQRVFLNGWLARAARLGAV